MQNLFLFKFLEFMGSGQDSSSGHSGQMMPFLLPDSYKLEELLEWELIAEVLDVEGEKSM